jgi:hypothetical protein
MLQPLGRAAFAAQAKEARPYIFFRGDRTDVKPTGLKPAPRAQIRAAAYRRGYSTIGLVMREPGLVPKPLPPRTWPLGRVPLPVEGCGVGPLAPPPVTAVGGEP